MIARICLAFLLLTGGQSLVSASNPPKIPDYYVIPIGDDEPGGGNGGWYRNCVVKSEHSSNPMYCVYSDPKQTRRACFIHKEDAEARLLAEKWKDSNCQR